MKAGEKYGILTVVRQSPQSSGKHRLWEVRCDCGMVVLRRAAGLVAGSTKSCGCLRKKPKPEPAEKRAAGPAIHACGVVHVAVECAACGWMFDGRPGDAVCFECREETR